MYIFFKKRKPGELIVFLSICLTALLFFAGCLNTGQTTQPEKTVEETLEIEVQPAEVPRTGGKGVLAKVADELSQDSVVTHRRFVITDVNSGLVDSVTKDASELSVTLHKWVGQPATLRIDGFNGEGMIVETGLLDIPANPGPNLNVEMDYLFIWVGINVEVPQSEEPILKIHLLKDNVEIAEADAGSGLRGLLPKTFLGGGFRIELRDGDGNVYYGMREEVEIVEGGSANWDLVRVNAETQLNLIRSTLSISEYEGVITDAMCWGFNCTEFTFSSEITEFTVVNENVFDADEAHHNSDLIGARHLFCSSCDWNNLEVVSAEMELHLTSEGDDWIPGDIFALITSFASDNFAEAWAENMEDTVMSFNFLGEYEIGVVKPVVATENPFLQFGELTPIAPTNRTPTFSFDVLEYYGAQLETLVRESNGVVPYLTADDHSQIYSRLDITVACIDIGVDQAPPCN